MTSFFFIALLALSATVGQAKTGNKKSLLPGFEPGMPLEVGGIWVGDEKYPEEGVVYLYCSRAIFTPQGGQNYLLWLSAEGSCADNGIDQTTGKLNDSDWFRSILVDGGIYIEQVDQYKCLPADYCDQFDVWTDTDPGDVEFNSNEYTVEAKSCLQQIKIDNTELDLKHCETIQVNPLKKVADGSMTVMTTTAYYSFTGNLDAYVCPAKPVYSSADMMEVSESLQGSVRFYLQQSFDDLTDPCSWTCYDDKDGKCA